MKSMQSETEASGVAACRHTSTSIPFRKEHEWKYHFISGEIVNGIA